MAITGDVILGFSASYSGSDGALRTHRGADIAMVAGAPVESPVSGTVKFAGRVPSAAGGTLLCITVESDRGVVTLMPFERVEASAGDRVAEGQSVGTIAAAGDPSSDEPHLHLGLKKGDVYLDPTGLLASALPTPEVPKPASVPAPVTVPETPPSTSPAPATAATPVSADVPAAVESAATGAAQATPAPTSADVSVGEVATDASTNPVSVSEGSATSAAGGAGLPVGVTLSEPVVGGARPSAAPGHPVAIGPPQAAHPASTQGAASSPVRAARFKTGRIAPAAAVLAAALAGGLLLFTRRALTRRITAQGPVSDRFGILLQHLKAGDTLCGLTSCPGPLPSQSRGH